MINWQLASSPDKDYIFYLAKSMGWLDNPQRVQVKKVPGMNPSEPWYIIEPYEEDCSCPDLIYPPVPVGE